MRKPRDFDAELKALTDKARLLKSRKQGQLGELVMATGADALTPEELAGALLDAGATIDTARKEAWRKRGAEFFQNGGAAARRGSRKLQSGAAPNDGGASSTAGPTGAP
ncbi:conjugal transfer protein TraD [Novosphingobium sp. PS1R-30]|uniref:Conjugal transfer protein TraD n=1 Tax=Novosphingobium anseongense TaxID=3133436 RepID=A0ABU8S2A5_9SPHN